MKKTKITVLFDTAGDPPIDQKYINHTNPEEMPEVQYQVVHALRRRKNTVTMLGFYDNIQTITEWLEKQKPDIIFNLTEHFNGQAGLDHGVAGLLDLLGYKYTGSETPALLMARNKAITKELLRFHRVKTPAFIVCYKGTKLKCSKKIKFPLIVKPLAQDASIGISQSSIVNDLKSLEERILFVHQSLGCNAIAEEFILGRELYVSILGNRKLRVMPIREMIFEKVSDEEKQIATFKAKWDFNYRDRCGIENVFAKNIPDDILKKIGRVCKRTYRALRINDYGRIDIRLTPEGKIYVLEANPNPYLAKYEDFPESAEKAGFNYSKLIDKIVKLALKRYELG